jgi:hypothetical protein
MSDEDDQQRFTAKPLSALTQREHASDLCRGRDATFWRRVDGLLAKNHARGNGMGGGWGGTTMMAACQSDTMRDDP